MLNCDEQLEWAVKNDNYEKVRALLCRGANANHRFKKKNKPMPPNETRPNNKTMGFETMNCETVHRIIHQLKSIEITTEPFSGNANIDHTLYLNAYQAEDTLLHWSRSVEITRELLLYGAEVNCLNKYRECPLHSAIVNCKEIELVRELLKHGADVNARSGSCRTPLHYALEKQVKNSDVIKLLLQYGANFYLTELANSPSLIRCADTVNILIKITVIRNFDRDDVRRECPPGYNSKMWLYQLLCMSEVLRLKKYNITDGLSLYEFLTIQNLYITPAEARIKLNDQEILTLHPIYQDLILDKLKFCIKRSTLMDNLRKLEFYMKSKRTSSNQDGEEKKIILNFDSTYNIVKYICNDDLENLIVAFYKGTIPLDFSDSGEFIQQDEILEDE